MGTAWTYRRLDRIEIAWRSGDAAARLRAHFHETDQIAALAVGRRRIRVERAVFDLGPGDALFIPRRTVHQGDGGRFTAVNVYLNLADSPSSLRDVGPLVLRGALCPTGDALLDALPPPALRALVARLADAVAQTAGSRETPAARWPAPGDPPDIGIADDIDVRRAAAALGIRRETFVRRFSRRMHMPPAAYGRQCRLNHARDLLAANVPPAGAASETGFADQSHLGRWFRATFGTTPATYRHSPVG